MEAINKNYIQSKLQKINALRDIKTDEEIEGLYVAPRDNAQYIHFMEEFLNLHQPLTALIDDRFLDQSQKFSNMLLDVYVLRKNEVEFVNGTAMNAPHTSLNAYCQTNHTVH